MEVPDIKHRSPNIRSSKKVWAVIIFIVIAAHLVILIFFKPHYLNMFKSKLEPGKGESSFIGMENPFSYIPLEEPENKVKKTTAPNQPIVTEREKNILNKILNIPLSDKLLPRGTKSGSSKGGESSGGIPSIEPKPLYIPWPEYPHNIKKRVSGSVELKVLVDEKGEVLHVKLIKGLPLKKLNETAIKAAYNVRFSPGLINGKPSKMWVKLTIGFRPG